MHCVFALIYAIERLIAFMRILAMTGLVKCIASANLARLRATHSIEKSHSSWTSTRRCKSNRRATTMILVSWTIPAL